MTIDKTIGKILKFLRIKAGLSIRDCASQAELSPGTVQKFESGATAISPRYYKFISQYAGPRENQLLLSAVVARALKPFGVKKDVHAEPQINFVNVIELYWQGLNQREIAQKLKLSIGKVQHAVDKYNSFKGE